MDLGHRRILVGAAAIGVALIVLVPRLLHGGGHHVVVPLRSNAPARARPTLIVVDVAGAVQAPGLYRLAPGTRIADAVAAAGGATAKADVALVNLAAPLADGEQVLIPLRGGTTAAGPASSIGPVDLNTATAEQLDALPGIGPATAQKILDYRQAHGPFHDLSELDAIPGIGPARIAQLTGLVVP